MPDARAYGTPASLSTGRSTTSEGISSTILPRTPASGCPGEGALVLPFKVWLAQCAFGDTDMHLELLNIPVKQEQ